MEGRGEGRVGWRGGEGWKRRRLVGFARCACAVGEGEIRQRRGGALMGRPLPRPHKEITAV